MCRAWWAHFGPFTCKSSWEGSVFVTSCRDLVCWLWISTVRIRILLKSSEDQPYCRLVLNADMLFFRISAYFSYSVWIISASKKPVWISPQWNLCPALKHLFNYLWKMVWYVQNKVQKWQSFIKKSEFCDRQSLTKLSDRGQLMSRYISFMNLHPPASSLPLVC